MHTTGLLVLIIDKGKDIGGAWCSLNLFGLNDVENAIHYFMPDPYAFKFMKNYLSWDVIRSEKKYRIFYQDHMLDMKITNIHLVQMKNQLVDQY